MDSSQLTTQLPEQTLKLQSTEYGSAVLFVDDSLQILSFEISEQAKLTNLLTLQGHIDTAKAMFDLDSTKSEETRQLIFQTLEFIARNSPIQPAFGTLEFNEGTLAYSWIQNLNPDGTPITVHLPDLNLMGIHALNTILLNFEKPVREAIDKYILTTVNRKELLVQSGVVANRELVSELYLETKKIPNAPRSQIEIHRMSLINLIKKVFDHNPELQKTENMQIDEVGEVYYIGRDIRKATDISIEALANYAERLRLLLFKEYPKLSELDPNFRKIPENKRFLEIDTVLIENKITERALEMLELDFLDELYYYANVLLVLNKNRVIELPIYNSDGTINQKFCYTIGYTFVGEKDPVPILTLGLHLKRKSGHHRPKPTFRLYLYSNPNVKPFETSAPTGLQFYKALIHYARRTKNPFI